MFWLYFNEIIEINRIDGEILNIATISFWMEQFLTDRTRFVF